MSDPTTESLVHTTAELDHLRRALVERDLEIARLRTKLDLLRARTNHVSRLAADAARLASDYAPLAPKDDLSRCAICGWTLAETVDQGCVRGCCSHRPRPEVLYAPLRAAAEAK